jgi:pyruvate dehydrogenase E1 component beta subunit
LVHESPTRCGVGGDIVRQVVESDFGAIRAAPRVLGGADVPIPFARPLESACIPQVADIVREIRRLVLSDKNYSGK